MAKNVVLFIGDGMGLTTITAARILKGQLEARHWSSESRDKFPTSEEGQLAFETFDNVALSKVRQGADCLADQLDTSLAFLINGN